jgi:hypothetical protein
MTAASLTRRCERIANTRLLIFLAGALVAWFALVRGALSPSWLLVPAAAFGWLIFLHDRARKAERQAARAVEHYTRGLERLDDRWIGHGEPGVRFLDESHPYAQDLDLFGEGSLFELLSTPRTSGGEETLAAWLCAPAEPEVIRSRQAAVSELRPRLDLREDLATLGPDVRAGLHPVRLQEWGAEPPLLASRNLRLAAIVLALFGIAALVGWGWLGTGHWPLVVVVLAKIIFERRIHHQVELVLKRAQHAGAELSLLSRLLARLEQEAPSAPRLAELRAALETQGLPASRQIARLDRLIYLVDSEKNLLFGPIAFLLLWSTQLAFAIEAWRAERGPAVGRWLAAVSEIEALSALAGHAYEQPADSFPEIVDESPLFDAEDLGHPLIPRGRVVRNDVRLDGQLQVLVVSGSNMSGKSTLLRTVGANAVLALAGGTVRAQRLRLSPLAVSASIGRHDSLQAGVSRFYAEITHLGQMVEMTDGPLPLLFLVDELLHGTNSHDRAIGAKAIVRSFVDRGAIGLVTTHDLTLAAVADALAPRGANVHFQDHLENGKIAFDYRMHPGIVTRSNALALMRAVGLDV